ncbi:MAG: prepilin-type N-terminal cleavage/methylation domain-containing protein [Rhizobacter sp.]
MRPHAGFTLLELLVVLAIASLLIALVPIAFDRLQEGTQYRNALRTMQSEMRQARQQAVTQGSAVRFQVDLAARTYGLVGKVEHPIPEKVQVRATVASVELRPDQTAAIQFLPSGGATGGSVDLLRPSGAGTRLKVDWLSGRVMQEPITP